MGFKGKILFFIILFVAISLRLVNLDKGYSSDEGWLLRASEAKAGELIPFLSKGRSVYPPLSPFLLGLWRSFGNNEIWVRSYFVSFGIALCLLVYFLGKFLNGAKFGLLVFFIAAVSPLLIWASQFIRSYADSSFWVILSAFFLVKLLKDGFSFNNILGYILASTVSLYSSYLNIIILFAYNLAVLALYFHRGINFLRKWFYLQLVIGLMFLPCLSLFLKQSALATAIDVKWGERGFNILGINIGYYARGVAALFGMDPAFLALTSFRGDHSLWFLCALAALAFSIMVYFSIKGISNLRKICQEKRIALFFPVASILSLLIYIILVEVKHFPLQPEYLIAPHILFLFVVASALYSSKNASKINYVVLGIVSLAMLLRFGEAVKPEFDTKKSAIYLSKNTRPQDCILLVRNTNHYITPDKFRLFNMSSFLNKGSDADIYEPLSDSAKDFLLGIKTQHENIWFYRLYGNDEILGANKLIMDWLFVNGYVIEETEKMRMVDIIKYQRKN